MELTSAALKSAMKKNKTKQQHSFQWQDLAVTEPGTQKQNKASVGWSKYTFFAEADQSLLRPCFL